MKLETLENLINLGFHIFPLQSGGKLPAISSFAQRAAKDMEGVKSLWLDPILETVKDYNVAISTSTFSDGKALLVVDVDMKNGINGEESLIDVELNDGPLPETLTQITPSGGSHLIYWCVEPVKQGAGVLGQGLDIRSSGGYIVGTGSIINGSGYRFKDPSVPIAMAPEWLIEKCGKPMKATVQLIHAEVGVNVEVAMERAKSYLIKQDPVHEGQRNDQAYLVANKLKDFGLPPDKIFEVMLDHWQVDSMLPEDELRQVINSAFKYGKNVLGSAAPESEFTTQGEPKEKVSFLQKINETHGLIFIGGNHYILSELPPINNQKRYELLTEQSFKRKLAPYQVMFEGKMRYQADIWLTWKHRRVITEMTFAPGVEDVGDKYNVWSGFTCTPLPYSEAGKDAQAGLDAWLEHVFENVCKGIKPWYDWVINYFAHMIQFPNSKPGVAIVLKGEKGTGKNALIDRVGNLLGKHYLMVDDLRFISGHFNSPIEGNLLMGLDEAFWSGDKNIEGKIKSFITSPKLIVEHKGKNAYPIENRSRVVILGNEDWLVPASSDERRYAVFNMGKERQRDIEFFQNMRINMDELGGNRVLLHYLQCYPVDEVLVRTPPNTEGLVEQKIESLKLLETYWLESLKNGRFECSSLEDWPAEIEKTVFREAFAHYCKARNIRSWVVSDVHIGRTLAQLAPSISICRVSIEGKRPWAYKLPSLEQARRDFEKYIGGKIGWETEVQSDEEFMDSAGESLFS